MDIPSDEWLETLNAEFRANNIDVKRRQFLALKRYCKDFRVGTVLQALAEGLQVALAEEAK